MVALAVHYLLLISVYFALSLVDFNQRSDYAQLFRVVLTHCVSFIMGSLIIFLVVLTFQLITGQFSRVYIFAIFVIIIYDIACFHFINIGLEPIVNIISLEKNHFIQRSLLQLGILIVLNYFFLRKKESQ